MLNVIMNNQSERKKKASKHTFLRLHKQKVLGQSLSNLQLDEMFHQRIPIMVYRIN